MTPQLLVKLSIQLYLAGFSPSNTVHSLDIFGVDRVRPTVHNRVHEADLRPRSGHTPDHVAVNETVIQLDDDRYRLYAAVDPDPNELLHTKLEPTRTNAFAVKFFPELREKRGVSRRRRTTTS